MNTKEIPPTGVGALIVLPGSSYRIFATITEGYTKRSTHKLKGMRSIPMESSKPGESYNQTLERLFEEEIRFIPGSLQFKVKLCTCELASKTLVQLFLYEASVRGSILLGSHNKEVLDLQWINFEDVLSEPAGSLRFRPGVYESIISCLDYFKNPINFQSWVVSFDQLRCRIPPQIFDLIESGISEREAASRFGFVL